MKHYTELKEAARSKMEQLGAQAIAAAKMQPGAHAVVAAEPDLLCSRVVFCASGFVSFESCIWTDVVPVPPK